MATFTDPGVPAVLNLERRRGDTFSLILKIVNRSGTPVSGVYPPLDISAFTNIRWVADENKFPPDDTTEVFDISGSFVTDGTDGQIAFTPSPTQADNVGTFFQEFQWTDGAGKLRTFAEGKLKMVQDRAKG